MDIIEFNDINAIPSDRAQLNVMLTEGTLPQ
jgi:hypothetical protein